MRKESSSAAPIQSELESGTWYWRVHPVFSSLYQGAAAYSAAAAFQIEQSSDPEAPALELPDPVPTRESAPIGNIPVAGENYIVQPGDTLSQIARQAYYRASYWRVIAEANELADPNTIKVNQILFLPPPLNN
jgi:nucleoid-associated protein YgaU